MAQEQELFVQYCYFHKSWVYCAGPIDCKYRCAHYGARVAEVKCSKGESTWNQSIFLQLGVKRKKDKKKNNKKK